MTAPPAAVRSTVRAAREGAGLRPSELARQAGITRQALHAIETGSYIPNTVVALQLARVLRCRVEDLFRLPDAAVKAQVVGEGGTTPGRVQLAYVGPRLLAYPLEGEQAISVGADGVVLGTGENNLASIELLTDSGLLTRTAVVAGCDPSLGLLSPHVARLFSGSRVLWRNQPSLGALRSLARGEVHAAGIHLLDPATGEYNWPYAQRELPGLKAHLFTLWEWEQGLIVAKDNPLGLSGAHDLTRGDVVLANREEGAGSRALLDSWLEGAGLSPRERAKLPGYGVTHPTHLALARSIARGEADAGPGPRSAAGACGLDFVPVQRERFELVVPEEHLAHPAIAALLAVSKHPAWHAELAALGGYDLSHAGTLRRSLTGAP